MKSAKGLAAVGDTRHGVVCVAILLVAAALFFAMRLPLLSLPFERDEGEYAYIAQRMLVGEVPYRDAFDQKPPGVFLAYAAAFALFGQSVEAIHGFAAAWIAATTGVLFALVRRLSGSLAASFSVLIFALASADTRLGANAANTEIFLLLPMVASVLCAVRAAAAPRPLGWWLTAGALGAAACCFKQTAVFNALFIAAIALAGAFRVGGSGLGRDLAVALAGLSAGALAVIVPVGAGFALAGAWSPFIDSVVIHNLAYAQGNSWQVGLQVLRFWLPRQAPSLGVFWALAAVAVVLPGLYGRRSWVLLSGWLLASLLGVSVGFYYRPHYFVQLLPALSALGGVTLAAMASRLFRRFRPAIAFAGTAALVLVAVLPPWLRSAPIRAADTQDARIRLIYGDNPFSESVEIGKHIRHSSKPGDRVFVVGSEPQVLFYADRPSATRYIIFYPLTGDYPDALGRQREVVAELEAAPPSYVVWFNVSTSLLADEHTVPLVFDHTSAMLATSYELEAAGIPTTEKRGFPLTYGLEARRALRRHRQESPQAPWIAVFRRRR